MKIEKATFRKLFDFVKQFPHYFVGSNADLRGNEMLEKHADWVEEFLPKYASVTKENIDKIVEDEIGLVFAEVLEDAGVYKRTEDGGKYFCRFMESVGAKKN